MEYINEIRDLVDENKQDIPTEVVRKVMAEVMEAHKTLPNLWKISYVQVDAVGKHNAYSRIKTLIVEECEDSDFYQIQCQMHFRLREKVVLSYSEVFDLVKIPKQAWHANFTQPYFEDNNGRVCVVTKIEKYGKRPRDS